MINRNQQRRIKLNQFSKLFPRSLSQSKDLIILKPNTSQNNKKDKVCHNSSFYAKRGVQEHLLKNHRTAAFVASQNFPKSSKQTPKEKQTKFHNKWSRPSFLAYREHTIAGPRQKKNISEHGLDSWVFTLSCKTW